jgi:hypothetical protein
VSTTTAGTDNGPAAQAQGTAQQAKDKAQEAKEQAGSRLRDQLDQRSTDAGRQVSGTAEDARGVARHLREQGKEQPAKLAEQAADRADRLGEYLQSSDADRILRDVEDFGRRRPMAIMLGGLAVGFAASRFLKASSERRQSAPTSTPPARATTPTGAPTTLAAPPINTGPPETLGGDTPPVRERPATTPPPPAPARNVSLSGGVGPASPERPSGLG